MTAPTIQHAKRCSQCHTSKPYADFYTDRSRPGGYGARCKECSKTNARQRYELKRDERLAYQAEWRKKNPTYNRDYYRAQVARKTTP